MICHAFFGGFYAHFFPSAFARFYFLRVSRPNVRSSSLLSHFVKGAAVLSRGRGYFVKPRILGRIRPRASCHL